MHKNLIEAVSRDCIPSLVFRCIQGALSVFLSFLCIKYLSVSIVGVVCSLTPLIACLLAYILLNEKQTSQNIVSLIAIFSFVCLIMIGAEDKSEPTSTEMSWFPMVALLS